MPLDASGDRDRRRGASPDFTDTLDAALLEGRIDLAVHSAKDLPVELNPRLALAACPVRADPRDSLVLDRSLRPSALPMGARIGSSSLRRRAQLLRWRGDLRVEEVRGNVGTRIGLVRAGKVDGVILAVAGLARLGRSAEISRRLPVEDFLPSPAQGALAVVARAGDPGPIAVGQRIDDPGTHSCVMAERAFAASLGGDCTLPLAALAVRRGRALMLVGEVLAPDGRLRLRDSQHGSASAAVELGVALGARMRDAGAAHLIRSTPG